MATAEEKAAADKAAADKAAAEAAATGAQAVVQAVTKVTNEAAQAAVQAAAKGAAPKVIEVSGSAGGTFNIRGEGFASGGTVTFAGVQVKTTAWRDNLIKGVLPRDVQSGEVVIDSGGKVQRATFTVPR